MVLETIIARVLRHVTETGKNSLLKKSSLHILLLIIASIALVSAQSSVSFHDGDDTIESHDYDRMGQYVMDFPYGSDSYIDNSITNENILLTICHPQLSEEDVFDIAYVSQDGLLKSSIFHYRPVVNSVTSTDLANETVNCSTIDVDIASTKALYPGSVMPIIKKSGERSDNDSQIIMENSTLFFNGSYIPGVQATPVPDTYNLLIRKVLDQNGSEITPVSRQLVVDLLDKDNDTISKEIIAPDESLVYDGTFSGGEKMYVNGIPVFEIEMYHPCGPIDNPGYYVMNSSSTSTEAHNRKTSCITIENISDVTLNFAQGFVSGDGNASYGSMKNDTCAVIVKNADNITFENFKSYNFFNGLCVENSTVTLYEGQVSHNGNGIRLSEDSNVSFSGGKFSNDHLDFVATDNSNFHLKNCLFTPINQSTATEIDVDAEDVSLNSIEQEPPLPDTITYDGRSLHDMGQFIEMKNTSSDNSHATLSFYYDRYLLSDPERSIPVSNLSIYEYNGSLSVMNESGRNVKRWTGGTWSSLDTIYSIEESRIISPTIRGFSVFAPLGFPEKKDEQSSTGGTGGGGDSSSGSTVSTSPSPDTNKTVSLHFDAIDSISLMQGEFKNLTFSIRTSEHTTLHNVTVSARTPPGWNRTGWERDRILSNASITDSLLISSYINSMTGMFSIPVTLEAVDHEGEQVKEVDIVNVSIVPRQDLRRLSVEEYPPRITAKPYSRLAVSFKVSNAGDLDLDNITLQVEPNECIHHIQGEHSIPVGETDTLDYLFRFTGKENMQCTVDLHFDSRGDTVAIVPMDILISDDGDGSIPFVHYSLLILLFIWSLFSIIVIRRRNRRIKL